MILWWHYSCFFSNQWTCKGNNCVTVMVFLQVVASQRFFYFHPNLGKMNPFWLIFFKGVDTTNQIWFFLFSAYINARNGVVQFFTSHKAIRLAFDFFPSGFFPWLVSSRVGSILEFRRFLRRGDAAYRDHIFVCGDDHSVLLWYQQKVSWQVGKT